MSSHQKLLIIGGGVIGLSIACQAARRGLQVTLVERHGVRRDGCSLGNAGMICPSHFVPLAAPGMVALGLKWMWNSKSPFYIKPRLDPALLAWGFHFWKAARPERVVCAAPLLRDLSLASREAFIELARLPDHDFGLVTRGLLMLCRTPQGFEEEINMAARARDLGIPAEVLDPRQTAALDPGARLDIVGSVYFPKDCHLIPDRFVSTLERQAAAAGARFLWDTEVTQGILKGDRLQAIRTTRGELAADDFVLAGGSWSPALARTLGLRLPMQPGKGYSLTLAHPRQLPALCSILTEARVAVTPLGSQLRFGGTMELSGLDEAINPRRVGGIIEAACRYYPEFRPGDFAGIQPWRGLRPVSPDGLPFLGRCRRIPNLLVATGHAMLGLSLAPVTGRLITELACGEKPSFDLSLLDPERYG